MALSSHMKSKIFFTCFLEGLWQFVSGSAHEKKTTSTDELFLYIYIYNISDIIIPWKMYWSVLKIFNFNHHHHSGQNIFHYFCLFHGV